MRVRVAVLAMPMIWLWRFFARRLIGIVAHRVLVVGVTVIGTYGHGGWILRVWTSSVGRYASRVWADVAAIRLIRSGSLRGVIVRCWSVSVWCCRSTVSLAALRNWLGLKLERVRLSLASNEESKQIY